jgi:hypothetical protein
MAKQLMAQPSLPPASGVPNDANRDTLTSLPQPRKVHYFVNELVEDQLRLYIWTGCTRVKLRDRIMDHATELIRQIIRKQGLHTIYPGQEESSFNDLLQTAWVQIERTLYKFRARPHCRGCYNPDRPTDSLLYNPGELEYGIITYEELFQRGINSCPRCRTQLTAEPAVMAEQDLYGGSITVLYRGPSKVFNMWSQIARTVILAHIKKEGRDRKNSGTYRMHIDNRPKPMSDVMLRFLAEARDVCKYNEDHLVVLDALEMLLRTNDKPYDGVIGKLVEASGLSRATVTNFMKIIRLRSFEFTDSPINRGQEACRRRYRSGGDMHDDYD